ncbi:MAG: 3'(2'),5'-bisphosphate nucleotidase CysQ [Limisphaerales bacterium]
MNDQLQQLLRIVRLAGEEIMDVYSGDIAVEEKDDKSPLTEADRLANAVIVRELQAQWPEIPILSEESKSVPYAERRDWSEFWLVDPLDGTKEFIKRNGEFTVNIARVRDGRPIAGVVFQPTADVAYLGAEGEGAMKLEDGQTSVLRSDEHYSGKTAVRVVASRSHMGEEVAKFVKQLEDEGRTIDLKAAGSSLKLCLVAEGAADVYPRLGPTMEWDTGAAQCVAEQAGRRVLNWDTREPLSYNTESLLNPWFVVE